MFGQVYLYRSEQVDDLLFVPFSTNGVFAIDCLFVPLGKKEKSLFKVTWPKKIGGGGLGFFFSNTLYLVGVVG